MREKKRQRSEGRGEQNEKRVRAETRKRVGREER